MDWVTDPYIYDRQHVERWGLRKNVYIYDISLKKNFFFLNFLVGEKKSLFMGYEYGKKTRTWGFKKEIAIEPRTLTFHK